MVGCWCGKVLLAPWNSSQRASQGVPHFGKRCPLGTPLILYLDLTLGTSPPPALWTSPLPVSRALSVRSPRALMSRKGLFPMPMETICCTRSSREQRPSLLLSLGPPASVSAQPCSLSGLFLNSHTSLLSFDCQGMDWDSK